MAFTVSVPLELGKHGPTCTGVSLSSPSRLWSPSDLLLSPADHNWRGDEPLCSSSPGFLQALGTKCLVPRLPATLPPGSPCPSRPTPSPGFGDPILVATESALPTAQAALSI